MVVKIMFNHHYLKNELIDVEKMIYKTPELTKDIHIAGVVVPTVYVSALNLIRKQR